jgi:hypothetical protein
MSEKTTHHKPYRSFFWPVILLGAGVIWLLTNLNIIPSENLWILFRLWPVLIIMAGLDVLFARRLPLVGALLGLLVLAGVVYLLLSGANLGIEAAPEAQSETFQVEVGNTESVAFDLNLSVQPAHVHVLTDSTNLLDAQINHRGEIDFTVSGAEDKQIRLAQTGFPAWFTWVLPDEEGQALTWEIGLSPEVPFSLDVDASTGASRLDLVGVQLERFNFDGSTGASTILLPASSEGYDVTIEASTGQLDLILPAESNLTLRLDGSTGRITVDAPENAAVQVKVLDGGTGDLQLPERFEKVSGLEGRDEGIYQTPDFEGADYQLIIIIENISTGNILFQ